MIQLRELEEQDADALVKHLNNEVVIRYLTGRIPFPYTQKDAEWWIQTGHKEGIVRAIQYEEEFAGVIGVHSGSYHHAKNAEIGYWLGEDFWGKGIATKSVGIMTARAFQTKNIVRIYAPVFAPNKLSMRVLEKNGYTLDAVFRKNVFKNGELFDEHVYSKYNS